MKIWILSVIGPFIGRGVFGRGLIYQALYRLVSHEVIVNLIKNTATTTGLEVKCELDKNQYQKGIKISNKEFKIVKIKRNDFHGEWNYTNCSKQHRK